jgi:predicted RNase H-like nuclease
VEDELDAFVCAYVAAYYWTHGTRRCRVVGDLESGYIVTPVSERQARCLDEWARGAPAERDLPDRLGEAYVLSCVGGDGGVTKVT